MDRFSAFMKENKWMVTCIVGGIAIAALLFSIGLWRTLLLVVLVTAFGISGYLMDKGGVSAVKSFWKNLFKKDHAA